jgi:hypothetical protein
VGVVVVVPVGVWATRRVVQALWSACCPQRVTPTGYGFSSADALIATICPCCPGIQIDLPHR